MLVRVRYPISWRRSIKGVLSGITVGLFTPNRVGEFFGRVLVLDNGQRLEGAFLSMANGIAQTLATLSFGILGLILLLAEFSMSTLGFIPTLIIQTTLVVALLLGTILYYRIDLIQDILLRFERLRKYERQINVFSSLGSDVLTRLYLLSLVRFLTFIGQYIIVFYICMPGQGLLEVLSASILTLFSITLLPFVPIPDLLLRESFALGYFELYGFDPIGVSIVVFLVWGINIALPSVLGTITLFTYRFFKPTR